MTPDQCYCICYPTAGRVAAIITFYITLIQVVCIFLGECPRHEAAFINFWTVRHSATVFCDSTGGRGAAFITVIIVDGNIDNDGGNVDISGEFVNFHFFS